MKIFIALTEAIKIFELDKAEDHVYPVCHIGYKRNAPDAPKYTQVYLSLTLLFHNFKLAPKIISMATKKSNLYASNNKRKKKKKKEKKKEHRKSCKRNEKFKTYKILN